MVVGNRYPGPMFMQSDDKDRVDTRDTWKAEIKAIIREVVKDEIRQSHLTCPLDLTETDARQIESIAKIYSRIGNGEIEDGLYIIQENHRWLKKQRELGNKISGAFIVAVITVFTSSLCFTLWQGFKSVVKFSKGG